MVMTGDKAKRLSSVNHTTKTIPHNHYQHQFIIKIKFKKKKKKKKKTLKENKNIVFLT